MSALFWLAFAVAAAATPPAPEAGIAFPGQWTPPPPTQKYPPAPKTCWTRHASDPNERIACLESVAKDFGKLARFAVANAALPAPGPKEKRVVFFGDSITDRWSMPPGGGFFPGKRYVNRGIGSQTTGQMLLRFRADVIALAPRAVVILAGTNDLSGNAGPTTPEAILDNLASMVELARAHRIRVVLASLLPVCNGKKGADGKPIDRTTERPPAAIVDLNRRIAALAKKSGSIYLDYFSALVDAQGALESKLTEDGLHPNAAGYAVMAPLAEQALAKLHLSAPDRAGARKARGLARARREARPAPAP
jgi:lysophospholipase L1-like esterase